MKLIPFLLGAGAAYLALRKPAVKVIVPTPQPAETRSKVYLSRRNLETMLSKLDRVAAGEDSQCAIIKYRNENDDDGVQQTMTSIMVIAVEDDVMYAKRPAGEMHPSDSPPVRHETGVGASLGI